LKKDDQENTAEAPVNASYDEKSIKVLGGLEAVKREGVLTTLWHGSNSSSCRPSRELFEACDERHELTPQIVARILRTV